MIPFNKPFMTGRELWHIAQAHANGHLSGDGQFTKRSHAWLEQRTGAQRALLTHSCTAALEMAALLLDLQPGDEVIMPSYTFVSTANAFVLRGAVPVFVDIREDTLNLDERLVEAAITPRTRAICAVHYAGVACEMDTLVDIAARHGLALVEDAAQAIMSSYKGRPLGTIGELGAFSFHETKNIISGEGGALLCRDAEFGERAEILREKGTNRSRFFRGQVDKYTWVDVGSSFLPGEITAAFLCAQIEEADQITARRLAIWERYQQWAAPHEAAGHLRRPVVPDDCQHNAHMFYMLLPDLDARTRFISEMKARGVQTVFHYIPLHSAPAGLQAGRTHGDLRNTNELSERLVRMPLWIGVEDHLDAIFAAADEVLGMAE
ncbi:MULTISPECIES: dTDP-4-amino-4,6-dideoxygalactose transaminase [Stenotrophomonas]|uniref:dTDP-4-amino-4,6-dideoxygalactose transaminase n=1 Tax=Stenotrophomonas TaxID=40323 RepID=UPI000DB545B8|nr:MULTISPECIES: dTDP-4-amino-4,6-dideoxygalactose transaminase [Stenotrophomonas]ELF4099887.1 dTDP-4-amino-4,6-dideoxygalactose transaminase [Stenotrophomonas maltophilia]MBA0432240.1 dTDP-4-amino-4,6-dideoxygalactose transaminase [Stenotrophomonas maltophilia]MDH0273473.1 dTDP-4-amino-4,6-dideoxygalactose transaminase [Stenotrophomonas sp. GD04089]MDH1910161.1 dTDP-4-amino-4,6-dideoxygalactose transaminase [Stenotrophomonas sp. GD03794]MRI43737.1 dTDP-4-amino-4,6-dideoxygalactose transaminas